MGYCQLSVGPCRSAYHNCIPKVDVAPACKNGGMSGLVSIETVVLRRCGVGTNVWFINRVDKVNWPP